MVEGYLKHKSKLVATLANLVVNNNNVNGGEGKSADEKLDDLVRQIQIEFPTLHRHLQTLATHLLTGDQFGYFSYTPSNNSHNSLFVKNLLRVVKYIHVYLIRKGKV